MMSELREATLYREAADVKRYHTKRTIGTQTVGQHTFGMLMLVKQVTEGQYHQDDINELYHRVMHHDLPELMTGDVPGPIKRAHPQLGPLMDEIEQDLAPLYRMDNELTFTGDLEALLKWADRMDGAMWCMEELRMGNRNVISTIERYLGWLIAARIPDCASGLTSELVVAAFEEFNITPATGDTLEMKA